MLKKGDKFIGRPYFMVSEIANIFYEEEIIFITDD